MQAAKHFNLLGPFLNALVSDGIGDATTTKMRDLYTKKRAQLGLKFAAMLDMRPLVLTTYELEGDQLELLLAYGRVETLRSLGRSLGQEGVLRARCRGSPPQLGQARARRQGAKELAGAR
jgi:hypothetical protein